ESESESESESWSRSDSEIGVVTKRPWGVEAARRCVADAEARARAGSFGDSQGPRAVPPGLARRPEEAACTLRGPRLLTPEVLPRIVLQVADHFLQIVVVLFIHHESPDRTVPFLDVGDDRLGVGGRGVGARGELRDVFQRFLELRLLFGAAHDRRGAVEVAHGL